MRRDVRSPAAIAIAIIATTALLTGCQKKETSASVLDEIRARGELRVVTANSPTTYYLGAHGAEGLEFSLAREFAQQLGVALVITPVANAVAMQAELAAHRADIAAAQVTADEAWLRVGDAADPYEQIEQIVVYRRGGIRPRGTLQIENARLAVRSGGPQEHILQKLKDTVAPNLEWVATAPRAADPLEDVDSGQATYAIVDAREFSFARHLYPNLAVGFSLPTKRPAQWIVRKGATDLLEAVNHFFASITQSGLLAELAKQATGDARKFEYVESLRFQEHVAARLGPFRAWFEEAAAVSGIDWRLLAAIGYQESKWDPKATSGDGAQGVMMLMADTAQSLGITDRGDPRQSIIGGAKYFAEVLKKIPERIPEPDRTWLAVASYNVGFGHLEDARILTQSRGKNPDSWADVREHLPLLAQERYYVHAKRGYARGWEPVQFVDRVQRFLTLLEWHPAEAIARETRVEIEPEAAVPATDHGAPVSTAVLASPEA
ncbi:MAG: membrane-bound lytic murein transglycosylase MltF [Steroidobacteraceae bacterium]|nr:membrane-bound lytic murein transglycosylase MltF [Steroidobacteraceae bacterium]